MKNKVKIILRGCYIILCVIVGYKVLNFVPNEYPNHDDISLYYPSIAISLPFSYIPVFFMKTLNYYGYNVAMISGFEFRFHFFLISSFLGYFQYFYLFPAFFKFLKKD